MELTVEKPLGVQKPLPLVITAGQRGDSPRFEAVLEAVRVPRPGLGRQRIGHITITMPLDTYAHVMSTTLRPPPTGWTMRVVGRSDDIVSASYVCVDVSG